MAMGFTLIGLFLLAVALMIVLRLLLSTDARAWWFSLVKYFRWTVIVNNDEGMFFDPLHHFEEEPGMSPGLAMNVLHSRISIRVLRW